MTALERSFPQWRALGKPGITNRLRTLYEACWLPLWRAVCFTRAHVRLALPSFPFLPRALLAATGLGSLGLLVIFGVARCPSAQWLHVPCPGCGMTRSVLALAHLDFPGVLRFNALGPVQAAITVWIVARSLWVIARSGSLAALGQGEARRMLQAFFALQIAQLVLWAVRWLGFVGGPCPI